jgi:serine/threonine protein kinase
MVLDAERCRDLEVWTDIVRRTTVASRTADPTLARTWALEQSGGQRFIVCEDVGGTSLTAELAARGPRPVAEVGPLVLAIARAVAELHRLGVVHGGISLEALKREPVAAAEPATGRVRLLQFPLVADPHVVPPQPVIETPEGMHGLGTRVAFLAPELLLPGAACDPRSDVYAIGQMPNVLRFTMLFPFHTPQNAVRVVVDDRAEEGSEHDERDGGRGPVPLAAAHSGVSSPIRRTRGSTRGRIGPGPSSSRCRHSHGRRSASLASIRHSSTGHAATAARHSSTATTAR